MEWLKKVFRKLFNKRVKNKVTLDNFNESIIINEFDKPDEGGQFTYLENFEHPIRGIPRGWVLSFLDPFKRFIRESLEKKIWEMLPEDETKLPLDELVKITYPFTSFLERHFRMKAWEFVKHEVPYERMSEPVKEIWRLFDIVLQEYTFMIEKIKDWKRIICLFLEEDTAYRYRMQWMLEKMDKKAMAEDAVAEMSRLIDLLIEHEKAEQMKNKWRKMRKAIRIILIGSPDYRRCLQLAMANLDKKKIRLTEGDKEYFSCKFFKLE